VSSSSPPSSLLAQPLLSPSSRTPSPSPDPAAEAGSAAKEETPLQLDSLIGQRAGYGATASAASTSKMSSTGSGRGTAVVQVGSATPLSDLAVAVNDDHKSPDDAQERADKLRADGLSPHDDPAKEEREHMQTSLTGSPTPAPTTMLNQHFTPSEKDAGTTHIPLAHLATIAKRFAPLVWIDPDEKFRPCTFEDYLTRVNLYYDPTGRKVVEEYLLIKEQPTEEDLHDAALFNLLQAHRAKTNDKRLEHLTLDNMVRRAWKMAVRDDEGQAGVSWDNLNTVPFVSRVRRYADHWVRIADTLFGCSLMLKSCVD
jgi:hypothetical protein